MKTFILRRLGNKKKMEDMSRLTLKRIKKGECGEKSGESN